MYVTGNELQLEVICAGLGRTGTSSLQSALETLGYGPCYHMRVLWEKPSHADLWRAAINGSPDWPALLSGYRSVADEPAALYWQTFADLCPDAKVILNVRPFDDWYESVLATIHAVVQTRDTVDSRPAADILGLANDLVFDGVFGGDFLDRDKARRIVEARNQSIIDGVDDDRLLVYSVAEGWEPLCDFLSVPVPDAPFPHMNTRTEFRERGQLDSKEGDQ